MKEDLTEIIEEDFDVETYSATVCYSSSFGSGGSSSSFGSALSVSSSSSFGSPRNNSFYGKGIGSPINPSGPLASPFEIKKIEFQEPVKIDLDIGNINLGLKIDLGNVMEQNKYLQSALDLPKISSKFGAPVSLPETRALSDIVNQGMPAIPSSFGSGGMSFQILHPNENDKISKSIIKPFAGINNEGYTMDSYNDNQITVHIYGKHSGNENHPSNAHIDIGKDHSLKLGVERESGDNKTIKDLYPIFER